MSEARMKTPCGNVMGHGEYCVEGRLCDACTTIRSLMAEARLCSDLAAIRKDANTAFAQEHERLVAELRQAEAEREEWEKKYDVSQEVVASHFVKLVQAEADLADARREVERLKVVEAEYLEMEMHHGLTPTAIAAQAREKAYEDAKMAVHEAIAGNTLFRDMAVEAIEALAIRALKNPEAK